MKLNIASLVMSVFMLGHSTALSDPSDVVNDPQREQDAIHNFLKSEKERDTAGVKMTIIDPDAATWQSEGMKARAHDPEVTRPEDLVIPDLPMPNIQGSVLVTTTAGSFNHYADNKYVEHLNREMSTLKEEWHSMKNSYIHDYNVFDDHEDIIDLRKACKFVTQESRHAAFGVKLEIVDQSKFQQYRDNFVVQTSNGIIFYDTRNIDTLYREHRQRMLLLDPITQKVEEMKDIHKKYMDYKDIMNQDPPLHLICWRSKHTFYPTPRLMLWCHCATNNKDYSVDKSSDGRCWIIQEYERNGWETDHHCQVEGVFDFYEDFRSIHM